MNGVEHEPLEAAFLAAGRDDAAPVWPNLEPRCIACGAVCMWLRCTRCESQYQREQALYRSAP